MLSRFKILVMVLFASCATMANEFSIHDVNQSLVGDVEVVATTEGDTVITIAKQYNAGFNTLKSANPYLDMKKGFFPGTLVTIPNQHLLPEGKREGIIINLPEMRLYYFPKNGNEVQVYPIGIGKIGNTIPIKNTTIVRKAIDPKWMPTENIRKFNLEQGIVLPKVMRAGPDNPLGRYAIYTNLPTYLIHSTIFPESVGKRASFGCIRMYESDIERFFPQMEKNITVYILNKPIKVAFQNDKLYMEAHQPLEEHRDAKDASLPDVVHQIATLSKDKKPMLIDWQLVSYLSKVKDGMPHEVGFEIN